METENDREIGKKDLNEKLYKKDGLVSYITVNNSTSYKLNDWYDPDASVVIYYHSVDNSMDNVNEDNKELEELIEYNRLFQDYAHYIVMPQR